MAKRDIGDKETMNNSREARIGRCVRPSFRKPRMRRTANLGRTVGERSILAGLRAGT